MKYTPEQRRDIYIDLYDYLSKGHESVLERKSGFPYMCIILDNIFNIDIIDLDELYEIRSTFYEKYEVHHPNIQVGTISVWYWDYEIEERLNLISFAIALVDDLIIDDCETSLQLDYDPNTINSTP